MAHVTWVGESKQSFVLAETEAAEGLGCTSGSCHPTRAAHHQVLVLLLWTTGVINDQHDIDAIGLQQVHQKAPISLGVQSHASGMFCC